MKTPLLILAAWLLHSLSSLAAELRLDAPLDYQIVQRGSKGKGTLRISGKVLGAGTNVTAISVRIPVGQTMEWIKVAGAMDGAKFSAEMDAPAGGWYRVEVRALNGDQVLAEGSVEHVGVGEVFVVAGQSNSANHGEEKQETKTGRVATFDGRLWRLSKDPQPGASGDRGSFLPPFGDALVERCNVPVGFVACGIGATSVREWLPAGIAFTNPPTLVGRVRRLPSGNWESNGEAFSMLASRMRQLGPRGFRAVLWHQGESDANQPDSARTLSGALYRSCLERIIRESRLAIGWNAPWFVAQATYHVPGDEASADIRAAQASLWKDGIALEGPDTDAIKGSFREAAGKGVHFSGPGQREHAARWAEKVLPWLEKQP